MSSLKLPATYRPRSPNDNIFAGSSAGGVGGGYFPAAAGSGGRVISVGSGGGGRRAPSSAYSPAPGGEGMPYDFGWAVQEPDSGNEFTHEETSDGVLTSGQYRVNLPDGRVQLVTYTVRGDSGYQAEVTYEGEAQYPPTSSGQGYSSGGQPSYSAPAGGAARYSAPSSNQQRYSAPSSNQQRYSAPSSNQQRYSAPSSNQQRYSAPSSNQQSYSAPSNTQQRYSSGSGSRSPAAPSRGFPSRAGRRYTPAPSTQYGAAPSSRPTSPAPSTEYGAAPATPRYSPGQDSSGGFGSRLTPSAGVSYRGSGSGGAAPQLESTYGAPATPSQSYGAV
ncbi:Pro-resilin [Amphibalanus amphitrite]|uniref:Pro-resilin n=1 Tax=Amphibalanus amphitrite TaxID=1232801 RepID=A0A6A4X3L3_AMPAM|nr:Pro-resilin [Amphibalanus amphitrite]